MSTVGPVISAWSAASAFGVGRETFSAGVRSKRQAVTTLDPERWAAPTDRACLVPGGEPRELLGRKGTRSMDRVTGLAVAAVGRLLDDGHGARIPGLDEDTGLVLGTSNGSVGSIMSFTRDSLTEDRPYLVDPARFPNTVMNCAAGQSAIRHGLRGPNVTIAGAGPPPCSHSTTPGGCSAVATRAPSCAARPRSSPPNAPGWTGTPTPTAHSPSPTRRR